MSILPEEHEERKCDCSDHETGYEKGFNSCLWEIRRALNWTAIAGAMPLNWRKMSLKGVAESIIEELLTKERK